ncbi:unnamed protein product [Ambrosiozyma monospora]|uniref:Unnamed protein product n=1 Tax=Ambrosiozyma monospora TaxID=43982 RepID=A0A9W7DJ36_AMBMO|nr:unnamed protein product [Ambrosiozyma monospora]
MKFTNKCFYAKRHHPFLAKLIAKITFLVHKHQKDLLKMTYREMQKETDDSGESLIFSITGESIFTDTLFEYLNSLKDSIFYTYSNTDRDGRPTEDLDRLHDITVHGPPTNPGDRYTYKTFTKLKYPNVIDDTVILPRLSFFGEAKDDLDVEKKKSLGEIEGKSVFYYGRFDVDDSARV